MIFADKLIELRKKAGWTQEELAEMMAVSRQSIAKWEGAQSIPELSKIIRLSELFGVSTDYLLKDSIESIEYAESDGDTSPCRRVSLEEANRFLAARRKAAAPIAIGTMLCILSPICLILLAALSQHPIYGIGESAAVGIGMCVLLVVVAFAVMLFIKTGSNNSQFEYLERELIETEYGVDGMVKERRAEYKHTYDTYNIIGVITCILAVLPLFLAMVFDQNDLLTVAMVCVLLALVSVGVQFLVRGGVVWASYEKLLQVGEFSPENKRQQNTVLGAVAGAYWMVVTAVYLLVSFSRNSWDTSWIIWAVAGLLYPALHGILRAIINRKK